jgi:imidazolonepropionase-like amidohydrolase
MLRFGAVLVIDGERIKAVGPAGAVAVPAGAEVIHPDGKWLLPGLMNMHVHLGLKLPGAAGDSLTNETDVEEVLRMAGNARLSLLPRVAPRRRGSWYGLRIAQSHRCCRRRGAADQDRR